MCLRPVETRDAGYPVHPCLASLSQDWTGVVISASKCGEAVMQTPGLCASASAEATIPGQTHYHQTAVQNPSLGFLSYLSPDLAPQKLVAHSRSRS